MKASFLKEVVGFFDPMQSLDEEHRDWYVDRPDSPEEEIKVYLLNNSTDTKILLQRPSRVRKDLDVKQISF